MLRTLSLLPALALILGGCAAPAQPGPAVVCEPVQPKLVEQLLRDVKGAEPLASAAVRSPEHEKVWLVAVKFNAPGVAGETGVWASNALDGTGSILAVDGIARNFSVYPDAAGSAAGIRSTDPAVTDVKGCLG